MESGKHYAIAASLIALAAVVAAVEIYIEDRAAAMRWTQDGGRPPVMLQPCTGETISGCRELGVWPINGPMFAAAPLEVCNCSTEMQCGYREAGGFLCGSGDE